MIIAEKNRQRTAKADRSPLPLAALHAMRKQGTMRPGDRLGVAVSGGADSVALLLLLLELQEKLGVVLSVVHFNHRLRGKDSDADERFVENLAAKHRLEFHTGSTCVAKKAKSEKANLEDAARRARYDYFRSLTDSGACTRIAVAHTADDQAETVLAHILRGTGLAGLGGIHPDCGAVLRPLLKVRRSELRRFLRAQKQSWREDITNRDTARMRARIRMKLLPLLEKQFQPAIVQHLATLADLAREDEAILEAIAEERVQALVQTTLEGARLALDDLFEPLKEKEYDTKCSVPSQGPEKTRPTAGISALSRRMVRLVVESCKPRVGQIGAGHVEAVLELARNGQNGSSLSLPGGVEACRERNAVVFRAVETLEVQDARNAPLEFSYDIDLVSAVRCVRIEELGCVIRLREIDWPPKRGETSKDGAVLDSERLRFPLVLRNWRPGDRFRPQGHQTARKLKRLLNEKRVGRWKRNGWPVLTSGGKLIWARGFAVAAEYAPNEGTRTGILIVEEKF
jgi:tRNA(Ile)-lysidine synthase